MSQHLLDELARYQEYEEYAQKLRNLIEEDDELEVIMHSLVLTSLQTIENALNKRIHDVSAQIEQANNESMDKFINRRIT